MATTFTETTLSSTYKDDFRDSDNYHRILFNTGVGLQARELTQLQTILQNQISRFGNNVFKEGAVVKPGGANVNPAYEFIKLDETDPSHVMPADVTTLVGLTVTGQTSNIVATIIEAVAAAGSDPATLYVKYTNTSSAQSGTDIVTQRMASNEIMDVSDGTDLKVKLSTVADPSTGVGTQVTLAAGIYYARGNFVVTQDQSKIISKYTDVPSTDVGFKAVEETVTASDNNALYDNQGAVPNVSAPGADRYRITLTIAERSELTVNDNFIHVATIKDGQIYNAVQTANAYNIPNQVIAKRIQENSGDYLVKPYTIKFEKDSENTHLLLKVSDGTAVVDGFRASRSFPTTIRIPKPTATTTINNEPVAVNIGLFVLASPSTNNETAGIPNITTLEKLNLTDAVNGGGSTIGTARVRALTKIGNNIQFHLSHIKMNSAKVFRDVKSIGTGGSNYFNPILEGSKAVIKQPYQSDALFPLPKDRPSTLTDLIYTAQRKFTGLSANSSGIITLTGISGNPGETYVNQSQWIFSKADSDITATSPTITFNDVNNPTGGTASFNGVAGAETFASSSNIEISAYVKKTQTTPKQKTLTTFNLTNAVESDGAGFKTLNLKRADIFEVDEIVNASDSNESYSNRFILDNGQRATHYGPGRLILKSGQTAPSGNVFVKYKFFEPSTSGDYFSVNSYSGQVDYAKIPNYRSGDGSIINLREMLDFRSVSDSAGNFDTSGATLLELPRVEDVITSDVTYNLGRSGKLVIDRSSELQFYLGNNAFIPTPPSVPDGSLPLYDVNFAPATLNDSDLSTSKYSYKRFTMSDIGKLEERIERLEETTALTLLEIDTKYTKVLDSAGNDRTKSGFFVDDFADHTGTELSIIGEHRASLDPAAHQTRPPKNEDLIRLIYDSAESVIANDNIHKTIKIGDNVYVAHDEEAYINQTTASSAIKINPFAVTIYQGAVTLSPSSDEWRDVERRADKIIPGGRILSPVPARYFNDHVWNWAGNTNRKAVDRVVTDEAVLTLIEDRTIETVLVPFMRSRKVFFKAEGLRPNTQVFTFLDGNNITNLTNGGGGISNFTFYADTDSDFGNTLNNITTHPDGSSTLVTDGDGRISGSFIVPNSDTLRISSGTKQFKILDISVDNEKDAGTIAYTGYAAVGYLDTKRAEYLSSKIEVRYGPVEYIDDGGDGPDPVIKTNKLPDQVYDFNTTLKNTIDYVKASPISKVEIEKLNKAYFASNPNVFKGMTKAHNNFQLDVLHSQNQNDNKDNTGLGGSIGTDQSGLHT